MARAQQADVAHIMVTGTSIHASTEALRLARQYPNFLSATAGVHPHDAKTWSEHSRAEMISLLGDPLVIAVGECGLDYNRDFSPRDQQRHCFEAQLQLAQDVQKPLFLHQRDAHQDFSSILQDYISRVAGAVVHCFTGTRDEMEAYVELGCYIGITGWLCDSKRGQQLRELVRHIPQERLLIETDAPFLTPHNLPSRAKHNRNEPAFLPFVLDTLAELLQVDRTVLAEQIQQNSLRLFGLLTQRV